MQEEIALSLYDVSSRLGVSPSAIKKRVIQLGLPVQRGARGKLIFDRKAYTLLQEADALLKAGYGFEDCRIRLGLLSPDERSAASLGHPTPHTPAAPVVVSLADLTPVVTGPFVSVPTESAPSQGLASLAVTLPSMTLVTPAEDLTPLALPESLPAASEVAEPPALVAPEPAVVEPAAVAAPATEASPEKERFLPAEPVAELGDREAAGTALPSPADVAQPAQPEAPAAVEAPVPPAQPEPSTRIFSLPRPDEPAAEAPAPQPDTSGLRELPPPVFIQLGRAARKPHEPGLPPDLSSRLDSALALIEEKDRHNQMLQGKLMVAYDEMTKLSATAAAFQERSLNLAHEVQKLEAELRLLDEPEYDRPWWKFWG